MAFDIGRRRSADHVYVFADSLDLFAANRFVVLAGCSPQKSFFKTKKVALIRVGGNALPTVAEYPGSIHIAA